MITSKPNKTIKKSQMKNVPSVIMANKSDINSTIIKKVKGSKKK